MFTTKPRPAPSKAALRVLCQLAYISSGTVVGAGVLCAEERRRRTQIVQRIADNAKRIRQHPRHAANAALAVRDGEEEIFERAELVGGDVEGKRTAQLAGAGRKERMSKGRDLPSMVEEEYDLALNKERRRRMKRNTMQSPPFARDCGGPDMSGSSDQQGSGSFPRARRISRPEIKDCPVYQPVQPFLRPGPSSKAGARMRVPYGEHVSMYDPSTSGHEGPSVVDASRAHCRDLLCHGLISEAIEFFLESLRRDRKDQTVAKLFDELFDAALATKDFKGCVRLLQAWRRSFPLPHSQCEALIHACNFSGDMSVIQDLHLWEKPILLAKSSPKTRAILAVTCATDAALSSSFDTLYDTLDAGSRDAVDRQRRHLLLTKTWRRTKNLDTVDANLHLIADHLQRVGNDKALQEVSKVMVEIYISANRTDEALGLIARLHQNDRSNKLQCMLLAASAYAKRNAWDSVTQVLQIAESARLDVRQEDRRLMHDIVSSYVSCHGVSQTWSFVSYLKEKLRYRPSRAVHRSVLGSFVDNGAVSLIPKWLRLHKLDRSEIEMDSQTAAQLLTRHYQKHRPSHVLVMWLCRNLTHMVPSLNPGDFISLVTKSIGYDLSGAFERNSVWQQAHAKQRLERLRVYENEIPSPGYTYNRKLHFQHPNASADTQTSMKVGERLTPDGADPLEQTMVPPEQRRRRKSASRADTMYIELCSQRYHKVLELYEDSLDVFQAPGSAADLINAVRASLKLHGNDEYALQMIDSAERAGLNVTGAIAPVLIYRIDTFDPADPTHAHTLRNMAIRYYRTAERNSYVPGLDVGVNAANALITSRCAHHGVKLLRSIVASNPTNRRKSTSVVFMTVMVKGYAALGSIRDVLEWAHEALRSGVLISPSFVKELKRALKSLSSASRRDRAHLSTYIGMCKERRRDQAIEANILGKKLVATIARCMREEAPVDIDLRAELDEELFGRTFAKRSDASEEPEETTAELTEKPRLTRRERLAQNRERVAKTIHHNPNAGSDGARHTNRLTDVQWMRQYRAFLRQPMVLEDGQYASFQYYMPSQSAQWKGKERASRKKRNWTAEKFGWEHVGA